VEQVSQPAEDVPAVIESVPEPVVTAAISDQTSSLLETATERAKESAPIPAIEERKVDEQREEAKYQEPKQQEERAQEATPEESKQEVAKEEVAEVTTVAAPIELSAPTSSPMAEPIVEPLVENKMPEEPISSTAASVAVEPVSAKEPVTERIKDVAKDGVNKESEIAETTAAAWASWRRIRETGDSRGPSHSERHAASIEEKDGAQETSARAVAAGAEKSPEDPAASSEESPEIASIVDSVLAGMRPRIVEEISRKLGKK
jgi:hypothetical protein